MDDSEKDHDLLIRIDQNLNNLIASFNDHKTSFHEHIKKDNEAFEEQRKQIAVLQKFMWILIGAVALVEFGLRFIK